MFAEDKRLNLYTHKNWATIDFDWDKREVALNVRTPEGEIAISRTIRLSELQVSATAPERIGWELDTAKCPPVMKWWELYFMSRFTVLGVFLFALLWLLLKLIYSLIRRLLRLLCKSKPAPAPTSSSPKRSDAKTA